MNTQTMIPLEGIKPLLQIRPISIDEIKWSPIREKKKKFELTGVFEPMNISSTTHIKKEEGHLVSMMQFNNAPKYLHGMKNVILNSINKRITMYVKEIERRII